MLITSSLITASAAASTDIETETAFLKAIGVEGAETSTANATLTRAEASKFLAQALGMSADYKSETQIFSDVPADNAYASAIAYLYDHDIVNGNTDGTFRPDSNVTYGEFIKMAVSALGYKDYAGYKGGWTKGYLDCARDAGLLSGVASAGDFTKGKAFTVLYNMLHANRLVADEVSFDKNTGEKILGYSEGNVLMKDLYDLEKHEGLVTASTSGSISGSEIMQEGTIKIDYEPYVLKNATAGDYTGYNVTYYTNKSNEIIVVIPNNNKVYTVIYDKIRPSTTVSSFDYKDDNKNNKTLKIASDAFYTYNGTEFFPLDSDLKPAYGKVTLIDNNKDNKIDVVKIFDYKDYVVKAASDSKLYFEENDENKYLMDYEKDYGQTIFINSAGEIISALLVGKEAVLSVAVSKNNELCTVIVSNDNFEGTITSITNDGKAVIDDYEYTIYSGVKTDEYLGKYSKFYLDADGAIVRITMESEEKYAVLNGVMLSGDMKDQMKVRLFDSGKFSELDCSKKVKISENGGQTFTSYNNEDAYNIVKAKYNADTKQLIKYVLKDGKLDKLMFAEENSEPSKDYFRINRRSLPNKTYQTYREFFAESGWDPTGMKDYFRWLPDNTYVYIIGDSDRLCSFGLANDIFTVNDTKEYTNYKAYDMTETGIVQYIVIDASVKTQPVVSWNEGSDIAYITDKKTILDDNGDPIQVYESLRTEGQSSGVTTRILKTSDQELTNTARTGDNAANMYPEDTINFKDLNVGDVIQYTYNQLLEEVTGFVVLSKAEDLPKERAGTSYTGANFVAVTTGIVENIDTYGYTVTNSLIPDGAYGKKAIITRCNPYYHRDLITIWNVNDKTMRRASWDDIVPGMKVWNYTGSTYTWGGKYFIIIEE